MSGDSALVVANVALVVITLAYVVLTGRMVGEMKRTRLLAITPHLALGVRNLGAGLAFITITNVGKGAALDVSATLQFDGLESRSVAVHMLTEGACEEFLTPRDPGGELMRMDELSAAVETISLRGSMRDALGNGIAIRESISVAAVWEITKTSRRHLPRDEVKRLGDEIEKLRRPLEGLGRTAERAYGKAWPYVPETGSGAGTPEEGS